MDYFYLRGVLKKTYLLHLMKHSWIPQQYHLPAEDCIVTNYLISLNLTLPRGQGRKGTTQTSSLSVACSERTTTNSGYTLNKLHITLYTLHKLHFTHYTKYFTLYTK